MAQKRYKVTLTEDEETTLHAIINKGKRGAQKRKRAQAPLLANEGHTDEAAAERTDMSVRGMEDLRKRFVENGFESSLEGKPRGHRPRALSGEDEARLIALVCGPAPEGYARRALRLLEDRRVTLEGTDNVINNHGLSGRIATI
jgi:transposase